MTPTWDDAIQRLEARIEEREKLMTDQVNRDAISIMQEVEAQRDNAIAERDGAYRERAQLLAWVAGMYRSYIYPAPDVEDEGWSILMIHTMMGQLTWHIAPGDLELFPHIPRVTADHSQAQWDGHTTEEKYNRIQQIVAGYTREESIN